MEVKFEKLKVGYHREHSAYSIFFNKKIDTDDLQFISDKIARHFKLGMKPTISVYGYRVSRAFKFGNYIKLSSKYGLNFGTLCHELNHFICWEEELNKKFSKRPIGEIRHGTKKWNRNLQRLLKYCQRKNFWEQEISKRHEPKQQKPEPTKEEIQQQKINKAETKIKRYETKIRMYQRKLSRTKRSLVMLKKRC